MVGSKSKWVDGLSGVGSSSAIATPALLLLRRRSWRRGAVVPCVSPYYILFYSMFNLIYLGINPRAHKGLRARREALLNVWYPITVSPYYMYGKSVKKEVED